MQSKHSAQKKFQVAQGFYTRIYTIFCLCVQMYFSMGEMMKMYGMTDMSMFGNEGETLILNANNTLVQYVLAHGEGEYTDMICQQLYDLALLSHKPLEASAMTAFIERSNKILQALTK